MPPHVFPGEHLYLPWLRWGVQTLPLIPCGIFPSLSFCTPAMQGLRARGKVVNCPVDFRASGHAGSDGCLPCIINTLTWR